MREKNYDNDTLLFSDFVVSWKRPKCVLDVIGYS